MVEDKLSVINQKSQELGDLDQKIKVLDESKLGSLHLPFLSKRCFSEEFIRQIYISFNEYFDLSRKAIQEHLSKGVTVHHNRTFRQDFDLSNFLEAVEEKKMRISLNKYGFQKKVLVFDFSYNKVLLMDVERKKQDSLRLEQFQDIQLTQFSLKCLKVKMVDFYSMADLGIYS